MDSRLKRSFWIVPLALIAIAALLQAQAVSQLVGLMLTPPESALTSAPPARSSRIDTTTATRRPSADSILSRNPFDHVTGPLATPPTATGETSSAEVANGDPWAAPACDDVDVQVIMASDDPEWSFAAIAGADGKSKLLRRRGEVGARTIEFIGWDRVWLLGGGSRCQAKVFDGKKRSPPSAAPAPPTASASSAPPRPGAKTLDPDIKKGIQKVSATEFNIDRGTLDKILENQAELMRQARVLPEQENGRVVGIRLLNIRPDSLLSVLGMQNGDRLQTINGFEMASPEKALEAYARLRTADKLTVQVNRGGKTMNLDYNVR